MANSFDQAAAAIGRLGGGGGSVTPSKKITGGTAPQKTCNSIAKCKCSGVLEAQRPFKNLDRCDWIKQLVNNKPSDRIGNAWDAEVRLDMTEKKIWVTTYLKAINETGTYYNGKDKSIMVPLEGEAFEKAINSITARIAGWWNKRPYKLRIKDRECGDHIYTIIYNPSFVEDGAHYTIHFYNIPMTKKSASVVHRIEVADPQFEITRSFVSPYYFSGYFNLGDRREETFIHEFGHALGLLDEYYRPETGYSGVQYDLNGDQGPGKLVNHVANAKSKFLGMMGGLEDHTSFDGYALTVAKVIIRHMDKVWGTKVEEWEIV